MEIKISKESLDAFRKGERLIPAPIDDKNLLEDPFEDEVFGDFLQASDHRKETNKRHLIGSLHVDTYDTDGLYIDGFVDVKWQWGTNTICIELIACPASEDFFSMREDFARYYTNVFKGWENPDNPALVVKTTQEENKLYVSFFTKY